MGLLDKIKDNSKQGEGKLILTGIANVVVSAINPTMDELKAMGQNPQQEPSYTLDRDGVPVLRLDVHVSNPNVEYITPEGMKKGPFSTKITYWLENSVVKNKDGSKTKFINNYGQTAYATSKETLPEWYDREGVRECHKGEEELITLLYKWLGLTQSFKDKKGDTCVLDTPWDKLVGGNVSELKTFVKAAAEHGNGLKFLFGAKEGDKDGKVVYYQDVYTKYPMKPGQFSFDGLVKTLNDEYGQFKAVYHPDLKLRAFVPTQVFPDVETPSTPAPVDTKGDLPF